MQHRFRYNTYIILEHLHCILALLFSLNDYKKKNMLSIFTSITLNNYLIKWNTLPSAADEFRPQGAAFFDARSLKNKK